MNEPVVLIDSSDPEITVATLNRPSKRNALSIELMLALHNAVLETEKDRARRILIIRGAGPAFCAGLDLQETSVGDPSVSSTALKNLFESVCLSPLVIIAAAHGAAMGGGAGLLLACDLAVVADDLQLAFPEVRRGLVAALVTCLLRRHVGDRTARQLLLLGQSISALDSLKLALVNRVVPLADLPTMSIAVAREVCLGAPSAIARTKHLLATLASRPITEDLNAALAIHNEARHSPEAAEGIAAFKERRPSHWPPRAFG